ncbi:hypothetical protein JET18_16715 [Chryseobacterium sp. L7]|uniref:YD repeat-containing protein n=1 Tax=Chryseobacterium endalhagicum TaxID=2797638 RepID=A0ABS1QJG8_9FLAO|nr:hypothetical protein [Chryseobacterium endalhagicum]MBL1222497.1 hypothetical protein [Chryseobacterium endalhagicum]
MNNQFLRIKILFFILILVHIGGNAQTNVFEFQKESILRNYEGGYSKGKTDVSIPLGGMPTSRSALKIDIGLSYNTENVSRLYGNGDAGLGWNIDDGAGSVSRYLYFGLNDNMNVYQYSFLGRNGRFYIKYDKNSGSVEAVESYPSTNKILIQKQSDSIFTSFKIIDENGFKYIFDKKSVSYRYEYPYITANPGHSGSNPDAEKELYTSAFLLTKILDEKDRLMVDYEYLVRSKSIETGKMIVQNRVKKINIHGVGTVSFNYNVTDGVYTLEDRVQLNTVLLKNKAGQLIKQYSFEYSSIDSERQNLYKIIQKDNSSNELGKYTFSYHNPEDGYSYDKLGFDLFGYPNAYGSCSFDYDYFFTKETIHPRMYKTNFLKTVTYPTGGKTEYDYEVNTVYAPNSIHAEIEKIADINENPQILNNPFTINNPQNYSRFFVRTSYGDLIDPEFKTVPDPNLWFDYKIYKSAAVGDTLDRKMYQYDGINFCSKNLVREFNPGTTSNLFLRFMGNQPNKSAKIYGIKKAIRNFVYAKGGRIKSVKTFERDAVAPVSVIKFDYSQFSDASKTSGVSYMDAPEYDYVSGHPYIIEGSDFNYLQEVIMYQNVKVTDSIKNTSVKYTYLMPEEMDALYGNNFKGPLQMDLNHSLKKAGIVKKIEKFDSAGNLVEETNVANNFEYVPLNGMTNVVYGPLKYLWIKSVNTNSKLKVDNVGMLESQSQKFFESANNLMTKEVSTDFSGSVTEHSVFYPNDLNNQKLLTANLISIPLKTEIKQEGVLVARTETKFDNPAHVFPTSQVVYNMDTQAAQTQGDITVYDEMGNAWEAKSKDGIPVVTIWGYHKTQPIAVIIGALYADIINLQTVQAAIAASDADNDNPTNEPALMLALNNLRNDVALKNFQIKTMTYDPLIGVTSAISPSGFKEVNVYDAAGRLQKVMDSNGKTLKEFKYNYKP